MIHIKMHYDDDLYKALCKANTGGPIFIKKSEDRIDLVIGEYSGPSVNAILDLTDLRVRRVFDFT